MRARFNDLKSILLEKNGMSLLQVTLAVGFLAVVSVMVTDSINGVLKTKKQIAQSDAFDRLKSEIEVLLSDQNTCANSMDESLATPTNPKFCQGGQGPIRIRQDLGAFGFSLSEDRILVGLPEDSVPKLNGMSVSATMTKCDLPVVNDQTTAVILLRATRPPNFELTRTINITLNYQAGNDSLLASCTTKGSASSSGQSICENVLKGTWNPLKKPPCQGFAGAPAGGGGGGQAPTELFKTKDAVSTTAPQTLKTSMDAKKCRVQFRGQNVVTVGNLEISNRWMAPSATVYTHLTGPMFGPADGKSFEFRQKLDWVENLDDVIAECSGTRQLGKQDILLGLDQRAVKPSYFFVHFKTDLGGTIVSSFDDYGVGVSDYVRLNSCLEDFYVDFGYRDFGFFYRCEP